MFSKTCEYALRAMMYVGQKSKDGAKVGIKEIAEGTDSPEYFIAKVLQGLTRKDLIRSQKGPSGGFYLDEKRMNCTLAEIVMAIDGDEVFKKCGLGLKECSEKMPCPIHHDFKKIKTALLNMLQSTRLDELNEQLEKKIFFLKRT